MLMEYTRLNPTKEIPDLRVMDFSSIKSDTGFTIATVYSDSNIKIWQFDLDSGFHLLKSWFYSTCCILNCQFLNNHYLLISTTDGCVTIYDIATAKPVAKEKLHQSGVKAISIHQDYLITGGDDNAITVLNSTTHLSNSSIGSKTLLLQLSLRSGMSMTNRLSPPQLTRSSDCGRSRWAN